MFDIEHIIRTTTFSGWMHPNVCGIEYTTNHFNMLITPDCLKVRSMNPRCDSKRFFGFKTVKRLRGKKVGYEIQIIGGQHYEISAPIIIKKDKIILVPVWERYIENEKLKQEYYKPLNDMLSIIKKYDKLGVISQPENKESIMESIKIKSRRPLKFSTYSLQKASEVAKESLDEFDPKSYKSVCKLTADAFILSNNWGLFEKDQLSATKIITRGFGFIKKPSKYYKAELGIYTETDFSEHVKKVTPIIIQYDSPLWKN